MDEFSTLELHALSGGTAWNHDILGQTRQDTVLWLDVVDGQDWSFDNVLLWNQVVQSQRTLVDWSVGHDK